MHLKMGLIGAIFKHPKFSKGFSIMCTFAHVKKFKVIILT